MWTIDDIDSKGSAADRNQITMRDIYESHSTGSCRRFLGSRFNLFSVDVSAIDAAQIPNPNQWRIDIELTVMTGNE
jgi:hypothetical protein